MSDDRCLLCDEPFAHAESMTCSRCGLWFERVEGRRLVANPWPEPFRNDGHALRDALTIAVREVVYQHCTGRRVLPEHCVRVAMGFLLDLHCRLEGAVLGLHKQIANLRSMQELELSMLRRWPRRGDTNPRPMRKPGIPRLGGAAHG